jgi:2-oxoisovalerate dehydrogenase E1 component beta subunit
MMAEVTLLEAIRQAIDAIMAADERVLLLGAELDQHGGRFRVAEGLLAKYGPRRVLDLPAAPGTLVGVAIGAALNGMLPIVELDFADDIGQVYDQIVQEAARTRYRSNGSWNVPLVIRVAYGGGVHGGLYHSQSVEALLCHVPGLKVVAPATPGDAKGLLKSSVEDPDPVVFLEHKKCYQLIRGQVPAGDNRILLGTADVKRTGKNMTAIAYGLMLHRCLAAADDLAGSGIDVEVLDLRTLRPLDADTILASVRKTGKVLIVHEDNLTGGLGGEIAALIGQHAFEYLDAPIVRVCGPDVPAIPYSALLEEAFLPSEARIAAAMRQLAAY